MFNQFSWQEFLTAVTTLGIGYYVVTSLLLYHHEIIAFVKHKKFPSQPSPSQNIVDEDQADLMGAIKGDAQENIAWEQNAKVPDQIIVSQQSKEPEVQEKNNSTPLDIMGPVADLLQEVKALLQVSSSQRSEKVEVLRLLQLLLGRYATIGQTEYRNSINLYIYHCWNEYLPINLDVKDIEQCWQNV